MAREPLFYKELLLDLYGLGEAPAGSKAERAIVDRLLGFLRDQGFNAWIEPVPVVASWSDEGSWVEACGRRFQATAWPQSLGGAVEARAITAKPILSPAYWSKLSVEDRIVVVEVPEDPDDATTIYMHVVENGGRGVVFYDKWGEYRRRIVVTGSWSYSFYASSPAPIPVVHLRRSDGLWLASNCSSREVAIHSGARLEWKSGAIVVSATGDPRGGEVWVTAHHDHWLGGANDNLAGVVAALSLYVALAPSAEKRALVFASFTAEEFGCPTLSSWYWSCGSRYLVEELSKTSRLDNIIAVVNFDLPASPRIGVHASGFELHPLVLKAIRENGVEGFASLSLDSSYTDSFSFSSHGVPALSFMDIDSYIEYYHTDYDRPEQLDMHTIGTVLRLASTIIKALLEEGWRALDYRYYAEKVYQLALEMPAPPPVQAAAYRLLRETDYALKEGALESYMLVVRAFRALTSRAIKPVFEGDYRSDAGVFRTVFMPWLLVVRDRKKLWESLVLLKKGDREKAGEILATIPRRRVIPGTEEELPSILAAMALDRRIESPEDWGRVVSKAGLYLLEEASIKAYELLDEAYSKILSRRLTRSAKTFLEKPDSEREENDAD